MQVKFQSDIELKSGLLKAQKQHESCVVERFEFEFGNRQRGRCFMQAKTNSPFRSCWTDQGRRKVLEENVLIQPLHLYQLLFPNQSQQVILSSKYNQGV